MCWQVWNKNFTIQHNQPSTINNEVLRVKEVEVRKTKEALAGDRGEKRQLLLLQHQVDSKEENQKVDKLARATFSLEKIPQWEVEIKILEVLAIGADVIEVGIVTP